MFDSETRLGFGTYSLTGDVGRDVIAAAIEAGYRHVDTARLYGNEAEVGDAISRADVDREDLFVATKIAHFEEPEKTPEYVRSSIEESFERLGVDRIDLLYHHWRRDRDEIETVLPIIEEFVEESRVEHLGVSNYSIEDIEFARDIVDVPIAANQVETHPLLPQDELRSFLGSSETELVAYSPLAQGRVFDVAVISEIAEKHAITEAQVSLAWLLEKDIAAIPRTSNVGHLEDNLAVLECTLDTEDIARIDAIDQTCRCEDPSWMEW